jgi:hypothetical protein
MLFAAALDRSRRNTHSIEDPCVRTARLISLSFPLLIVCLLAEAVHAATITMVGAARTPGRGHVAPSGRGYQNAEVRRCGKRGSKFLSAPL